MRKFLVSLIAAYGICTTGFAHPTDLDDVTTLGPGASLTLLRDINGPANVIMQTMRDGLLISEGGLRRGECYFEWRVSIIDRDRILRKDGPNGKFIFKEIFYLGDKSGIQIDFENDSVLLGLNCRTFAGEFMIGDLRRAINGFFELGYAEPIEY